MKQLLAAVFLLLPALASAGPDHKNPSERKVVGLDYFHALPVGPAGGSLSGEYPNPIVIVSTATAFTDRDNNWSAAQTSQSSWTIVNDLGVSGNITAGYFYGDGQNITNLWCKLSSGPGSTACTGQGGNVASGNGSTVSGGANGTASGLESVVGGGELCSATERYTVAGGGYHVSATNWMAVAVGGELTLASGKGSFAGGGGYDGVIDAANVASGGGSVNNGGIGNTASGRDSVVPGGAYNTASGSFSTACGQQAVALSTGAYVWADSTNAPYTDNGQDTYNIRASSGVYISTSKSLNIGAAPVTWYYCTGSTAGTFDGNLARGNSNSAACAGGTWVATKINN